jgi:hypothetical protein
MTAELHRSTASSPPRGSDARQHEPLPRYCATSEAAWRETVPARLSFRRPATVGRWQIGQGRLHNRGVIVVSGRQVGLWDRYMRPMQQVHIPEAGRAV